MARPKSPSLTEGELRIMQILWDKQKATVAEVTEALKGEADLAYTTVLTLMQILERKGYLVHEKSGRAFVYEPRIGKQDASREAVRNVIRRFFNGSPSLLVLNILEEGKITGKALKQLRQKIDESK